jgi:hypothetical protein
MLTRLLAALTAAVATTTFALVTLVGTASSANAGDYAVVCPPNSVYCYVSVNGAIDQSSGGSGNSGGGGSTEPCHFPIGSHHHEKIDCDHASFGWWDAEVGCYYRLAYPQPADGPAGQQYYAGTCWDAELDQINAIRFDWFATPPYGFGGVVNIDYLIVQAINAMKLSPAQINTSPPPDGKQVVGVPTWLWTPNDDNIHAYGEYQASATAGTLTVTAVAHPADLRWDTGDGGSVSCHGPGEPWTGDVSKVAAASDCSHTYTTPGSYQITVNSHWDVDWVLVGSGINGVVPVDRTATLPAPVQVVEVQAINR